MTTTVLNSPPCGRGCVGHILAERPPGRCSTDGCRRVRAAAGLARSVQIARIVDDSSCWCHCRKWLCIRNTHTLWLRYAGHCAGNVVCSQSLCSRNKSSTGCRRPYVLVITLNAIIVLIVNHAFTIRTAPQIWFLILCVSTVPFTAQCSLVKYLCA